MDGFLTGNVVQNPDGSSLNNENSCPLSINQNLETEEDYALWNGGAISTPSYEGRTPQAGSGSEPPNKRPRNAASGDSAPSHRAKAIGKMFYKTKLCCKFRAGTCPYITNCNFAHSVEELRKPPPNWQDIVAAHEGDRGASSEPREEFQIPILGVTDEAQRSHKGRHCKKFYTEEGCPYGDTCTFMHDEQSRSRESVAISLGPSNGAGAGGVAGFGSGGNGSALKPSNWKTRICNKWELTGYCPFGSKCHFAHGSAELNQFTGGSLESENRDAPSTDAKRGSAPMRTTVDSVVASVANVPHSDGYHAGAASQRLANMTQKTGGYRLPQKWKGPEKISKIYGDWIDDL